MRFKVKYLNRNTKEVYWVTVDAIDLPDARIMAERKMRKGFIVALIEQEFV